MKKIFLLLLLAGVYCLPATAQSRTNTLTRPCPAGTTPTRATVAIAVNGSITVTPCSGRTVTINGTAVPQGVKVYRALLTQTSTNAPVATVLENSLGGTLVWGYSANGVYTATLAGVFLANKVFLPGGVVDANTVNIMSGVRTSDNVVTITVSAGNDTLVAFPVEVIVYP